METQAADTAAFYCRWAAVEAHGSSPTYERLCRAVADSPAALDFLHTLPQPKRQPNLLLGALRWFEAPVADPEAALTFLTEHAQQVRELMLHRATQTNETARCAVLLPGLALLPGPLAVLELGASAGLCLMVDAWSYAWTDETGQVTHCGSGDLLLSAEVSGGVPVPTELPAVAARLGLDAHPVDVTDPRERRWLECLVWPEHTDRADRLRRALDRAAATPPPLRQGLFPQDVADAVATLRRHAPEATVVVMHSAAAAYLDPAGRRDLAAVLDDLGVHRLGLEGLQVSADLGVQGVPVSADGRFLLSLDGQVLGSAHPHGRDLHWLAGAAATAGTPVQ